MIPEITPLHRSDKSSEKGKDKGGRSWLQVSELYYARLLMRRYNLNMFRQIPSRLFETDFSGA